ncbi:MAG: hypothetical protein LBM67_04110 [Lentimicrobiaceae bacterium]|nr:hypothetical protein [Lentimicrobiaceae bacterium]
MKRLLKPLKKIAGTHIETTFDDAFETIAQRLRQYHPDEVLVMANGRYSNEELYLIQKLARAGIKTNALASSEYLLRGSDFCADKNDIVPFSELYGSSCFFCIGFDENNTSETLKAVFQIFNDNPDVPKYFFNQSNTLHITDFTAFFKSLNYHLIAFGKAKGKFVEGLGKNYESYKNRLLSNDFEALLKSNNLNEKAVSAFTDCLLNEKAPTIIYWEKALEEATVHEMNNLTMLIDVQVKPSSGLLGIKQNPNSQGLFDMGIFPHLSVGGNTFNAESKAEMELLYGTKVAETKTIDIAKRLQQKQFKAALLFGEDLTGMQNKQINESLNAMDFIALQTSALNETAQKATVVLPQSLISESEGVFTDSARSPHRISKTQELPIALNNLQQLSRLGTYFGLSELDTIDAVFLEYIAFFKAGCNSSQRHYFR